MRLCICLQLYPGSVVMWHSQTENQRVSFELWAALPPQPQLSQLGNWGLSKSATPLTTNIYWHAVGERHVGKCSWERGDLRRQWSWQLRVCPGMKLQWCMNRDMSIFKDNSKHIMYAFSSTWQAWPPSKGPIWLPLSGMNLCDLT